MSSPDSRQTLAALLYHVGGEPFALPLISRTEPDLVTIGSLAGLPVWAAIGDTPAIRRTARHLARRARLGVVLASSPDGSRWFAAVTIQPVLLVAMTAGDMDALPLRRLTRAARPVRETPLETAIALAEALDTDAAGRRTFRVLHRLLDQGIALLPSRLAREDRHAWVLAQLTRLLFLRFVEAEGWLDGNRRFLIDAFDRCLAARRDPTRQLLQPLFFGTLNRPVHERSRLAREFGAIPFLNGGLFEPRAVERAHRLHLPSAYWRDVFAALVERVDVTLDHDPHDGCVTPELLGRVFEGAMHPAERKQQGTFFTPPALVDAVLREALTAHLALRLRRSEPEVARAIADPDRSMLRTLLDVTVLDPAVGSGAFLVGALSLLHGPGVREPARVRMLVTRRLFGVDLHPGAVRITELRLWLEVLRAMRGRTASRIPPLPNLDATVRAGDALIDPVHGAVLPQRTVRQLVARQRSLQRASGTTKRRVLSELRTIERSALLDDIRAHEQALEWRLSDLLQQQRSPTLFGDRPTLGGTARREIRALQLAWRAQRAARRRLTRDTGSAPFALTVAFAAVVTRRAGFDLVAGNPPWVRAERLPPETRRALGERYRWWRGGAQGAWRHLPDLAVAFVERGHQLLAPGGTLAFLLPAKLATAAYASTAREALMTRATIHCVADLSADPRAGFEATTYPLALIASRSVAPADHTLRLGLTPAAPSQPQSQWSGSAPWVMASPMIQRVAARLMAEHPSLRERVRPQLGVKTGANAIFVDPPDDVLQWCRPAIRGRDVRPFVATAAVRLLWPADSRGIPWSRLPPALADQLAPARARLLRRADQLHGPWWQLFRTRAATAPHRVIWRDLAPQLEAAVVDDAAAVPLNSCYVAAMPSAMMAESLAAWLNTTPIRALARITAEPAAGGCARFAARTVGGVPWPVPARNHPGLIDLARQARTTDVQPTLDDIACELLSLSRPERHALDAVAARRR